MFKLLSLKHIVLYYISTQFIIKGLKCTLSRENESGNHEA